MNEEEIKAIEYWKEKLKDYKKEIIERQNDEFKGYGTLEDIAKLNYCTLHTVLNLIEKQKAEIELQTLLEDERRKQLEQKDKIINMLIDEREYIKNNLEVDLNKKGIFSQAKGQISQILEHYKNNDKYFENKVKESK